LTTALGLSYVIARLGQAGNAKELETVWDNTGDLYKRHPAVIAAYEKLKGMKI